MNARTIDVGDAALATFATTAMNRMTCVAQPEGQLTCIMCGCQETIEPGAETRWRAVIVGEEAYCACPKHLPAPGSSREAYRRAYVFLLARVQKILGVPLHR